MKKTLTLVTASLILNTAYSQFSCVPNTFYGLTSTNEVVSLTLNGTTIINNGVLVPAGATPVNSLAVATDLINGSSQSFFYSSTNDSVTYYNGTNWQSVLFDPVTSHNAGGAGNYMYYQVNSGGNPATIKRFDGVSLNTIYANSNLTFSVADIGVTPAGNIFFFSGQSANSQFLHEISPSGAVLNTWPFVFNSANAYGCFVMNDTIYVGIGPVGGPANSLLPVTISGATVTAGAPMSMPALNFKDLAGCSDEITGIFSSPAFEPNAIIYPNPVTEILHIETAGSATCRLKLMDVSGRLLLDKPLQSGMEINMSNLKAGVYIAEITIKGKIIFKRIQKL
ncbi:MAG TPA: T9SS type A sorting domain-containing protein [Bacteroidia bacterium]|nr:T9SS type A sorting domain-containing protein [Bacteroidia bacterium]